MQPEDSRVDFSKMSDDQIRQLISETAEEAANLAVQKTLLSVGMDVSSPDAIIRTQDAVKYMYRSRDMSSLIIKYGVGGIVTTVVGATITLLWMGVQDILSKGHWGP